MKSKLAVIGHNNYASIPSFVFCANTTNLLLEITADGADEINSSPNVIHCVQPLLLWVVKYLWCKRPFSSLANTTSLSPDITAEGVEQIELLSRCFHSVHFVEMYHNIYVLKFRGRFWQTPS